MINKKLLPVDTENDVNEFTTVLAELINTTDEKIGFDVKCRNGAIFNTKDMVVLKNILQNWYFRTKDFHNLWYADGSNVNSKKYDLISIEKC